MTVASVAVVTKRLLFGMCDRTVDSDGYTGDFASAGDCVYVWVRALAIACASGHRLKALTVYAYLVP